MGWEVEHQFSMHQQDEELPITVGHFPALSLVPMPCPDPVEARQAEAAQAGAWSSMRKEGSCAVFGVEVTVVLLLASDKAALTASASCWKSH